MNFHRPWTIFALDAEHDAYGMARIAQAHNTCMSELASARAERDIACTAYENAKRELAAARADAERYRWLTDCAGIDFECMAPYQLVGRMSERIDAALAGEKK